jgi:hypothetical protein
MLSLDEANVLVGDLREQGLPAFHISHNDLKSMSGGATK